MSKTCVAMLLAFLAGVCGAQEPDKPAIETAAVAPGIYVLYGNGGNIGVSVGADGVFLIDDQISDLTPPVIEALAKLHPQLPRLVINTHWHHDHTGGNEQLAGRGSIIVAHDNVRARMSADNFSAFLQRTTPASPAAALPVITFNDSLSLFVNGGELRGIHVGPAHTDGDVFIHLPEANVIHTGDLMFAGLYPFVDLDSGGSVTGVIAAVDQMLALANDETRIIPGHGRVTDRAGLVEYRRMLADTHARMQELVASGKSLEEVLAARPFADYDAALSWPFITAERYVQILYRDAVRELSPDRT